MTTEKEDLQRKYEAELAELREAIDWLGERTQRAASGRGFGYLLKMAEGRIKLINQTIAGTAAEEELSSPREPLPGSTWSPRE